MASSSPDDEIISMSPSLSISAAKTEVAPSALVEIFIDVNVGFIAPLFLYHAISSS